MKAQFLRYLRKHKALCITQSVLIVLLAVVGFCYGKPLIFLPFLLFTVLSWTDLTPFRWGLYVWSGLFLAVGTWQAFQKDYLANLAPGDYSLAFSLALVLVFVLVTFSGNRKPPRRNLQPHQED